MTTINCSSNCIHQIEGKCTLDTIPMNSISVNPDCIFFQEKASNKVQCEYSKEQI